MEHCDIDSCDHLPFGQPKNTWCWMHCHGWDGRTTEFLRTQERARLRSQIVHYPECSNIEPGERVSQIHYASIIEVRDVSRQPNLAIQ